MPNRGVTLNLEYGKNSYYSGPSYETELVTPSHTTTIVTQYSTAIQQPALSSVPLSRVWTPRAPLLTGEFVQVFIELTEAIPTSKVHPGKRLAFFMEPGFGAYAHVAAKKMTSACGTALLQCASVA